MKNIEKQLIDRFRCPICKSDLMFIDEKFYCQKCSKSYIMKKSIPDFYIKPDNAVNNIKKSIKLIDILSKVYESSIWYPTVYHMYGGINIPSISNTIKKVTNMIKSHKLILDVACGTGLYTRALAEKSKYVYGIDFSRGMLEKAKTLAKKKKFK
ncbi:MAG: methyltransferase domain-containing protein [Candidatus Lokiarchaeota archaeon]|nr:methyltransferase domain-containing protein [Candidatus Lokiarchaeota archaeon]